MFNLDPAKLLILAVVAVLLLGPDRLPQVARQAGAAWRTFNEFRHRMEAEVRNQVPDLPSSAEIAGLVRSPTALLNKLSTLGEDGEPANGVAGNVTSTESALPDGAPIETTSPGTALSNSNGNSNSNSNVNGQHPATPTPTPSDAVFGDPGLN
jgi:sec-independent protein translocase protein TatB